MKIRFLVWIVAIIVPFSLCAQFYKEISPNSPVIYDNDEHRDVYTDEMLLLLSHLGRADVKLFITTYKEWEYELMVDGRQNIIDLARENGYKNIPPAIEGTKKTLKKPASNRIEDTKPLNLKASNAIVNEALNASPSKPLVILCGGQLTAVADAYLQNPAIANNAVVYGVFGAPGIDYNGALDAWAWTIVISKFRCVAFKFREPDGDYGRAYKKAPRIEKDRLMAIAPPNNSFFKWMVEKQHPKFDLPGYDGDGHPLSVFLNPDYIKDYRAWSPVGVDAKGMPILLPDVNGSVIEVTDADADLATRDYWEVIYTATGGEFRNEPPVFPLKVSDNGRHFVDRNGKPFLYNADTNWKLFYRLSYDDAKEFLSIRKEQGFNTIQVSLLPFNPNNEISITGEHPLRDMDVNQMNVSYIEHVNRVISLASEMDMLLVVGSIWKDCCNNGWKDRLDIGTNKEFREYGRFLGRTFGHHQNLMWFHGGDNDAKEHTDLFRQIALGLKETAPHQLQTYHAASSNSSTDAMPSVSNTWMDFVWTYTYYPGKRNWVTSLGFGRVPHVYEAQFAEYGKLPARPFLLGESMYEGFNYGNQADGDGDTEPNGPEIMRRQAYWSILGGGTGHAYGSWAWMAPDGWKRIKDDPGANQMLHVSEFFSRYPWWELIPQIKNTVIFDGGGTYGSDDYILTACNSRRNLAIMYLPPIQASEKRELILNLNELDVTKNASLIWFNPATGAWSDVISYDVADIKRGFLKIHSPGNNGSEYNDWLLVIDGR